MPYEGRSASEFIETELVKEQLRLAAALVGREAEETFASGTESCLRHLKTLVFDSPLEVAFWIWWDAISRGYQWMGESVWLERQRELDVEGERFRLDFVVEPDTAWAADLARHGMTWPLIAIEVDGHGFHERTREQVALRDRRDRALQKAQWKVFHFSFSEFTQDPSACTREVWEYVAGIYHDLFKAMHHTGQR